MCSTCISPYRGRRSGGGGARGGGMFSGGGVRPARDPGVVRLEVRRLGRAGRRAGIIIIIIIIIIPYLVWLL